MSKVAILLATLATLWKVALTEIMVIHPDSLAAAHKNISYSLARFGDIDYRSSIVFKLFLPSSETACTYVDHVPDSTLKTAFLIERGDCSFSKKSSITFGAGADLAIVIKKQDDPVGDTFIPVPDGKVTKFNAPLIIIDYAVGQDLKKAVKNGEQVLLRIDFDAVGTLVT